MIVHNTVLCFVYLGNRYQASDCCLKLFGYFVLKINFYEFLQKNEKQNIYYDPEPGLIFAWIC